MKAARWSGIGATIVGALCLAYFGAYWVLYHTNFGTYLLDSSESPLQKAPPEVRWTVKDIFEPVQTFEKKKRLAVQKEMLPGEWVESSGERRVSFDADYRITPWGFSKEGLPDGMAQNTHWARWGVAGTESYLFVHSPGTTTRLLEVFVDYENQELLHVNVVSEGAGYGVEMHRKGSRVLEPQR